MKVFNTLGRRNQEFVPLHPAKVAMYVCGPTVQAAPHLGHGRAAVVFDVMRRYFTWTGYEVTYVVNVTDIEDKIIAAANSRGVSAQEVAREAAAQFFAGYRALGVSEASVTPYATAHVAEMIELISRLIERGHAYPSGGDVYFSVRSFPEYGKLSGHDPDELIAGSRVEVGAGKRDPLDFALWKAAKPGEPQWDSPWGPGRPGWHIECSAMSAKYLGLPFDIHGGGLDLVFPHHENEIAQSEAAHGEPLARYWLHNGMVNISGEKMAKSTGTLIGLLEAIELHPPIAIRLWYLRKHYRSPLDYSSEAIADAAASLDRLWSFRRRAGAAGAPDSATLDRFRSAMDDDFNTAEALAVLFDAVAEGNRRIDAGEEPGSLAGAADEIIGVLGIAQPSANLSDLEEALHRIASDVGIEPAAMPGVTIDRLVAARQRARDQRDFGAADDIRLGLIGLGIKLEDTADGTRWYRR